MSHAYDMRTPARSLLRALQVCSWAVTRITRLTCITRVTCHPQYADNKNPWKIPDYAGYR
jgi:hypothetical protein